MSRSGSVGQRGVRSGAHQLLQRLTPLRPGGPAFGLGRRRRVAQRAVRPDGVVIQTPFAKNRLRAPERCKQRLVQQLVAQATVGALDKAVLLQLAQGGVMSFAPALLAAEQDRHFSRAVVACAQPARPRLQGGIVRTALSVASRRPSGLDHTARRLDKQTRRPGIRNRVVL